jgi:geranylgeranylglycerol-phosphate geranylgeranyltransferase
MYSGLSIEESGLSALPFFLSAIGGFALNDYYDAEKDKINKPYRAIPSGKLTPKTVFRYGISMLLLAVICSIFFSRSYFELILYVICILGVASYNLFVKYYSLSKTFLTAIISSLPLFFSTVVFEYPKIYLLLPVATCCFILGREWLMDIRDIQGDLNGQIVTIAMKIGSNITAKLGFGLQVIAGLILLPIVIYNHSYWSVSLLSLIVLHVIILIPLWSYKSGMLQRRVIQLLWLPMLWGILLFMEK